jgi:CheY-like chemotaxis protein
LLDTFEQILDFAKINSFASKRQRFELTPSSARARQVAGNGASSAQPLRILKLVDIVAVIEDVVESVYSGRILSSAMPSGDSTRGIWSTDGTAESISAGQIDVFIHAAPRDWEFLLEPGALRRVVMNVFGNALKYTQKGTISVRLDVVQAKRSGKTTSPEEIGSPELLLTISDTGKGISCEYLRSDIFTPFSQEDVLSPGTGLGLSLVRDILRSLNGDIMIESQVGVGTTVKMNFPLGQPQEQKNLETTSPIVDSVPVASNLIKQVRAGLQGKALRFFTARNSAFMIPTSNHVIKDYLTEWFGMNLYTPDSTGFVDMLVVDECELNLIENAHPETLLLILCHRRPTWSTMTKSSQRPPNTLWLTLPCGPHQLARTLAGSVEFIRHTQPSQLDEPSPLGFTENLHELGTLLKHHNLSDPPTTELTLVSDTLGNKAASNITTTHHQVTLKANMPSSGLLADKVEVTPNPPTSLATESGAGVRILLVEDNAINLALLEKYLARTNPEILHTAVNGQEAVKSVQAMTVGYQYIFMDLSMPIMDGFEATRSIRLLERARQTESPAKIIALTGLGSDEHIMKAYAAGVDVFLTKPISFKDILRLLNDQHGQTTENKQ